MKFINLTPHALNIVNDSGDTILSVPPSGTVARVSAQQTAVNNIGGVDVVRTVFSDVEGLPASQPDTVYVVSTLVLQALKDADINRDDVVAPDTSPQSAVRNSDGQIVGVKRFQIL